MKATDEQIDMATRIISKVRDVVNMLNRICTANGIGFVIVIGEIDPKTGQLPTEVMSLSNMDDRHKVEVLKKASESIDIKDYTILRRN